MTYLDYLKDGDAIEVFESDTIPLIRYLSSNKEPSYLVVPGPINKKGVLRAITWIDEKNTAADNKIRLSDNYISSIVKTINDWFTGRSNNNSSNSTNFTYKYMLAGRKPRT